MAVLEQLKALCPTISVGTLTADLMDLGGELALLERAGVGLVHVDVMDGCFCPMLTVGPPYVAGLRTPLLKDVHLMIHEPGDRLEEYVVAGADILTVHVESAVHIHRVLQGLSSLESRREGGGRIVRGLALSPATPLDWLSPPLLAEIDLITLLGIDPGWSGQKLAPTTLPRLKRVKEIIAEFARESGSEMRSESRRGEGEILTCVDGGVTKANIAEIAAAGADLIVTGSAVFDGKTPEQNAVEILAAVRAAAPAARGAAPATGVARATAAAPYGEGVV